MSIEPGPGAFGSLLRRLRLAARMSQEDLAEGARMSVEGISLLERGRRRAPYRETIRLLADALGLTAAQRAELETAAGRRRVPSAGDSGESVESDRPHLPRQRTKLIGREADVGTIVRLLRDERIVSLVGTGGIGKTRTALAVGEALAAVSRDAVRLVEFAPLPRGAFVSAAVAQALDVKESPDHPLTESLSANLRNKSTLLIFDNCEHVVSDAAAVADSLLRACPDLRILVTSREPLRIAGEQAYRLPSLAVPARSEVARLTAESAVRYAAIALFVERARAADRTFVLSDDGAPVVGEICRLLDGIALAIELAAARVSALPVRSLLARLSGRFDLLTGGDRTVMPRHQTMRALIDWSYDLLTPGEQQLFERLSIFAGGCDAIEVSKVCGADGTNEFAVVGALASLVDKSLVAADSSERDVRYRLLESARLYAGERLAARGATRSIALRHAAAYLELAEQAEQERNVAPDAEWLARVEPELENWRAALTFMLGDPHGAIDAARLASALRPVWTTLAPAEGRRWLTAAQAAAAEHAPPAVRANLTFAATAIAFALSEYEAVLLESRRLVDVFTDLGEPQSAAYARYFTGGSLVSMGRVAEGLPELERALEAAHACANPRLTALILQDIAYGNSLSGAVLEARAQLAEALDIWNAIGATRNVISSSVVLAENFFLAGETDAAIELANATIARLRDLSFSRNLVTALNNLAAYYIACNRWDDARRCGREALTMAVETQTGVGLAWSLQHLSAVGALSVGTPSPDAARAERIAAVLGYVDARLRELGSPRTLPELREYDRTRAALVAVLGETSAADRIAAGAALTQSRAVDFASAF